MVISSRQYGFLFLNSYEHLLKEERLTLQEVNAYERRLESWLSLQTSTTVAPASAAVGSAQLFTGKQSSGVPEAVLAFEVSGWYCEPDNFGMFGICGTKRMCDSYCKEHFTRRTCQAVYANFLHSTANLHD